VQPFDLRFVFGASFLFGRGRSHTEKKAPHSKASHDPDNQEDDAR
jgi:hypothetical protein